jgi:hypothetical protein
MVQAEVRAESQVIRPILCDCLAKVPVTKWEMGEDGEVSQVTTITLVVKDITDKNLRRLARTALSKITLVVELSPNMEQTEFPDEDESTAF